MRRSSQTIAINLRYWVYASAEGARYNTYPSGSSGPVLAARSVEEREEAIRHRDGLLSFWREVDPEGADLFTAAVADLESVASAELTGWAAEIYRQDGIRLVDPCRYCRECRSRR